MKLTIDDSSTLQHLVINQLLLKQQTHPLVNTVLLYSQYVYYTIHNREGRSILYDHTVLPRNTQGLHRIVGLAVSWAASLSAP